MQKRWYNRRVPCFPLVFCFLLTLKIKGTSSSETLVDCQWNTLPNIAEDITTNIKVARFWRYNIFAWTLRSRNAVLKLRTFLLTDSLTVFALPLTWSNLIIRVKLNHCVRSLSVHKLTLIYLASNWKRIRDLTSQKWMTRSALFNKQIQLY
jgi:hypothetical protein